MSGLRRLPPDPAQDVYKRQAMDPSGSGEMIITFPYNTDSGLSGLNLSSGATYYFELQGDVYKRQVLPRTCGSFFQAD